MGTEQVELKRGRGRPKGSKNRIKSIVPQEAVEPTPTFKGCLVCGMNTCICNTTEKED